jgi:hypothetical protein
VQLVAFGPRLPPRQNCLPRTWCQIIKASSWRQHRESARAAQSIEAPPAPPQRLSRDNGVGLKDHRARVNTRRREWVVARSPAISRGVLRLTRAICDLAPRADQKGHAACVDFCAVGAPETCSFRRAGHREIPELGHRRLSIGPRGRATGKGLRAPAARGHLSGKCESARLGKAHTEAAPTLPTGNRSAEEITRAAVVFALR